MQQSNKRTSRSILWWIGFVGILGILSILAYYEVDNLRAQKSRIAVKEWFSSNTNHARRDVNHLRTLARLVNSVDSDVDDMTRIRARSIVCDLVRLPSEVADEEYEAKGRRWHDVMKAVLAEDSVLVYEADSEIWRVVKH